MMRDDELLDAVAALALGVLGPDEAAEVRKLIASDDRLRAEYEALRSVADLVGYSAEAPAGAVDEVQAARMKSRLMKAVRADAPAERPVRTERRPVVWPAWAAAAAALAIALVSALGNVSLRSDLRSANERIAQLETRVTAEAKIAANERAEVADIVAPDAKRFAVNGGEIVQRGDRVYIALHGLPALPSGKVFQAWTLAKGAKTVAPSVTFMAGPNGSAVVALPAQSGLAAVAVSVEPEGGSKAPTTKPLFVRPLS